jgi:hypothetical protein
MASLSYCPARGSPSRNTWPLRWRLDIAQDADNLQELNKAFALATRDGNSSYFCHTPKSSTASTSYNKNNKLLDLFCCNLPLLLPYEQI